VKPSNKYIATLDGHNFVERRKPAANRRLAKKWVQCLNEFIAIDEVP